MSGPGNRIRLEEWTDAAANATAADKPQSLSEEDIPMKTTMLTLLLGASIVAACDNSSTAPDARNIKAQAKPTDLLIGFGPTWHATKLSFLPRAINDGGTVVGSRAVGQDIQGVMYKNGTLSQLGISSDGQCLGNVTPTAISPSGIVAGIGGNCVLVWLTPGGDPAELFRSTPPTLVYSVIAVYDDWTVIVQGRNSLGSFVYERPQTGFDAKSPYGFIATAADGQKNVYGHTTSGQPARWSAAYGLQLMPVPAPLTGGSVDAADSRGDALGYLHDVSGGKVPILWSANSLVSVITQVPANVSFLNSSGRYVGFAQQSATQSAQIWTSINGAVTWLTSPDAQPYQAMGVNSCGSIIALAGWEGLGGALFERTSPIAPVCDQAPTVRTAAAGTF
jgi:hypothetical protein